MTIWMRLFSMAKRPTKAQRARWDEIVRQGCLVCGGSATIHHVTASIHGGRMTRRHDRVVPLCPPHHQKVFDPFHNDPQSVEALGHRGFYRKFGIDLLAEAERLADV
jgi:hypothetical protein